MVPLLRRRERIINDNHPEKDSKKVSMILLIQKKTTTYKNKNSTINSENHNINSNHQY